MGFFIIKKRGFMQKNRNMGFSQYSFDDILDYEDDLYENKNNKNYWQIIKNIFFALSFISLQMLLYNTFKILQCLKKLVI